MKLVKKWMVVPYEEKKTPSDKEVLQKILNNKNINNETKLKLVNKIRNKNGFQKDKENDSKNEEGSPNLQNYSPRAGPSSDDSGEPGSEPDQERSDRYDVDESTFLDANTTFKNDYDYLNPAEQTRSKSQVDRSFLNLEKQTEYEKKRKQGFDTNKMLISEPNKRIKLTAKRRLPESEEPVEAIKTPNTIIQPTPKKKKKEKNKPEKKKLQKNISSQINQKTPVSQISNKFNNLSVKPPVLVWEKYKNRTKSIFNGRNK
jgi:hypothetical protein